MDLRLGFFASHNGSNVEAILKNIKDGSLEAKAQVLICNNPGARVMDIAWENEVDCFLMNSKTHGPNLDNAILNTLREQEVTLIVLAGYMRLLGSKIVAAYKDKTLNLHPALSPKYDGMHGDAIHQAVIDSDDREYGSRIHIVTPKYDKGRILGQFSILRHPSDTAESLKEKALEFEHVLYSQVLRDIQRGIIDLDE